MVSPYDCANGALRWLRRSFPWTSITAVPESPAPDPTVSAVPQRHSLIRRSTGPAWPGRHTPSLQAQEEHHT